MLRYKSYQQVFSEVPDEITLYIPLTNCQIRCSGCNSKWLWEDAGCEMNSSILEDLISKNQGITCVCIGGGESDFSTLNSLFETVKSLDLKTCWYTGMDKIPKDIDLRWLDFIKIGPYTGIPINEKGTNQRFYIVEKKCLKDKIVHLKLTDITHVFFSKHIKS